MKAHLHIERLVVQGLPLGTSAERLRREVAACLEGLLTPALVARLGRRGGTPAPIVRPALPQGRAAALPIATAIRDALLAGEEPR